MRQFFFFLFLTLILTVFSACHVFLWQDDVELNSVSMRSDLGSLDFIPDYEKRVLSVSFVPLGEDGALSEGNIGGDNFDRFEEIIETVDSAVKSDTLGCGGQISTSSDGSVENTGLLFMMDYVEGETVDFDLYNCSVLNGDDLKNVMGFYEDVSALFTENVF